MAKRPWQAVIWARRDAYSAEWTPEVISTHRKAPVARAAVLRWLDAHPTVTTNACYHRDAARAPFGEVRNSKRPDLCGETLCPPEIIVPSVGEIGVW